MAEHLLEADVPALQHAHFTTLFLPKASTHTACSLNTLFLPKAVRHTAFIVPT